MRAAGQLRSWTSSEGESVGESIPPSFRHGEVSARDLAERHAVLLLNWLTNELRGRGGDSRALLATEMISAYSEMCDENNIHPRPWNPVACSFAKLIRQRGRPLKTYRDLVNSEGKKRRRRFYAIPSDTP
jgi:hypothetical protein